KLFPPGSEQHRKAELYAHKSKLILLCVARAHLGDGYLSTDELDILRALTGSAHPFAQDLRV
ncbi:MAG: hypothetical protein KAI66_25830, partial [Lentisphaeria bacterium]|nr:hypothetical protein [Lentisphaeria bacterium]